MNKIDVAIALACKAHEGQVDKAGQPYILHPLRVMLNLHGEDERLTGILHDAVEDGDISLENLEKLGFPIAVIEAIDCLSKRKDESYEKFISRLSKNKLARKVKIEDIKDNLNLNRLNSIEENDVSRLIKYHKALIFLKNLIE